MVPIPRKAFQDETSLAALLSESGVDTSQWGIGATKTVAHLLAELRNGDSHLERTGADLLRRVRTVWIDVHAVTDDGKRWHLIERRQVFNDGRARERRLPASLGEKCRIHEDPAVAARRGVAEELGLLRPCEVRPAEARENAMVESSYPGLQTVYEAYWFETELPDDSFRPEGYVEVQSDKCTYFEWEPE